MGKQKSHEVRNYLRRSIKFLLLSLPGIITGITLLRTTPVFAAHTLSIGSSTNVSLAQDANNANLYKGTDNLTLATSCPAGYSIQISSSDPYLRKDGTSTTDYFTPVATAGAALSAGTWGYNINNGSTYKGLSTSGVALTSGTNTSVPVYYAALDNNLPSGEYKSGTVTYTTAVDDSCLTYTITWNANGGSSTTTSTIEVGSALDKLAAEPTRSGYTFLGWYTAASGGDRVGLDANNGVSMPTPTNDTTYYAHWLDNSSVTKTMQETNGSNCPTSAEWRKDTRDNSLYQVVKIGELCVMVTNLKITGTITSQTGGSYALGASINSGFSGYTAPHVHTPTTTEIANSFKNAYTSTELGTYYNYCAASAGTVCSDTVKADATNSVCPSGWRLPTGGSGSEQAGFVSQKALNQPLYSGNFNNSSFSNATAYGFWWSASQYSSSASYQYYLRYNSGSLDTNDYGSKGGGYSVRCVAEVPKITWDANGGSSTTTETFTPGSALTKLAAEPTRSGYTFLGWYTAASGGTRIGLDANNGVSMPTPSGNTTYYAHWLQNSTVTTTIQDTTVDNCPTTAAWRKDSRDNSLYQVVKIGSLCVMVTNLKITGTITSQNGSSYNFSAGDLTSGNSYDQARTHLPTAANLEAFKNAYTSTEIGAWYNYCAASAGTVCNNTEYKDATNSVCPTNWRLPTTSEQSGFTSQKALFQPLYSGYFYYSSFLGATTYGSWWSASQNSSNASNQYRLYYSNGSLDTNDYYKGNGYSVRCVASPTYSYNLTLNANGGSVSTTSLTGTATSVSLPTPTATNFTFKGWAEDATATSGTIGTLTLTANTTKTLYATWQYSGSSSTGFATNTLQDNGIKHLGKTSADCSGTLIDPRTNVSYPIAYLGGSCWMTKNLYLPMSKALTTSDTNIGTNWTTPSADLTAGNSYDEARIHVGAYSNNTDPGTWFNFCAAAGGTSNNSNNGGCDSLHKYTGTYDVCPKGWRLPTHAENSAIRSVSGNDSWKFYAGRYVNGSLDNDSTYSNWWSSTASYERYQYILFYYGSSLTANDAGMKIRGYFVRCVRS